MYDRDPTVAAAEPTPEGADRRRVLRDVGGLPVAGGGRVRRGVVFRISGQLATVEELGELADAGVVAVVDLRGEDEDRSLVAEWAAASGATYSHEPIPAASGAQLAALVRSGASAEDANEAMLDTYRWIVDQYGRRLAGTLAVLAQGMPAGFGCAAGRDRTGIVASLLYDVLGVSDDDIVATYTSHAPSPAQLRPLARSTFGIPDDEPLPAGLEVLMSVRPEWISATLGHIRAGYGDIATYLAEHGFSRDAAVALRSGLVDGVDM